MSKKTISTKQMKAVYDQFGIEVEEVPRVLQGKFNALVREYIRMVEQKTPKAQPKQQPDECWQEAGVVGVDSGSLTLTDYPDQRQVKQCHEIFGQDKVAAQYKGDRLFSRQLNFDKGHAGAGVVVDSGIGDGLYPVFIRTEEVPEWGTRVAEVKVRFLPHPYFEDGGD